MIINIRLGKGNKSSKTTEIYTHVSTKSIQKIKNPIEDIDLTGKK
jgi:integrase/recombinase XerD